ncbi:glycoside hydrolase family 3 protein [soil metagenome]
MRVRAPAVVALAVLALAGCATTAAPTPTPTPTATSTPAPDILDGLSLEQKVGQLFMVGTPADQVGADALSAVVDRHVGAVFLSGRSDAGTAATAAIVAQFTAAADSPLLVATDQEGGEIQVLSGDGFSAIPSGLEQGAMDPADLEAAASGWGSELASAGVNLDLAPVADIPSGPDSTNIPIASYDREFGYDGATVEQHARAFIDGMRSAGVGTVIKHFPGLGLVEGNTDDSSGVTDSTIDADSESVGAFASLIKGGARMVMVSSAIYSQLDASQPAVFSSAIVTDLLRTKLGFDGVVLTDDLSGATQVQAWSPADRAILSIEAGADIVLVTRDPQYAAEMIDAVVAKATDDPAFAALVDAAARRVLGEKGS